MNIPADIHAHRLPPQPGTAIVSVSPDAFAPDEGEWYSVGIHPWHIASLSACEDAACPPALRHPQVLAVGEAGLDKLADAPMERQIAVFRCQARWAEETRKPLVIHLVKATDELLKVKRELRPSVPWILHGFRGKATLAEEYLRHGFYLSFGEKYQEEALRAVPADRLFIETDESTVPVRKLYARAAQTCGLSPDTLEETVRRNIRSLFF